MNKIQYGTILLLLLSFSVDARPTPLMCDTNLTESVAGNVTCSLCHVLVNIIDAEIKIGNQTIVEITEILEKICSVIKGPGGVTCELVVRNIQNIVKWISGGMPSNQICVKLNMCNSTLNIKKSSN